MLVATDKLIREGEEMSDFGNIIKEIRKEHKLSLKEVAKKGGLSHSYISQIENGKRNAPKPETIHRLAKGLKIDSNILMEKAGYIQSNRNEVTQKTERLETGYFNILSESIEKINLLHKEVLGVPIGNLNSTIQIDIEQIEVLLRIILDLSKHQQEYLPDEVFSGYNYKNIDFIIENIKKQILELNSSKGGFYE